MLLSPATPAEAARYLQHCRTERQAALLDARLQRFHGRLDARDGALHRAWSFHESVMLRVLSGVTA